MATLKVTVHEARDLPVMDRATGLADPYVVVKLDDMEHTTNIARRTRNPVWEHDVRFDTADLLVLQEDPLEVRVYDHDIISRDDIVGMVLLDCNSIIYRANPFVSGWFPLIDSNAGLHGDIRLSIRIKFHAAENPLAPTLPERYVRRLDPRIAERSPMLAAVMLDSSSGGNSSAHNVVASGPNEGSVSLSAVSAPNGSAPPSGRGLNSAGTGAGQSLRAPFQDSSVTFAASGNANSNSVSFIGGGVAGTVGQRSTPHLKKRSRTSLRSLQQQLQWLSPSYAPAQPGGGSSGTPTFLPYQGIVVNPSLNLPNSSMTFYSNAANLLSGSSPSLAGYDPSLITGTSAVAAAALMASASPDNSGPVPLSSQLPSPTLFPYLVEQDLSPLHAVRVDHPTLAAEEEGVFIFSAWRLDPAVFRVESAQSMMEELIVKADPEHVRFTNLRSSRSINDARVIQLFKLSGKVRRQLARKVLELQCNAVLGYVEEFDMEPNGIIVRAYGTPCVISQVKYVYEREMESFLRSKSRVIQSNYLSALQNELPLQSTAQQVPSWQPLQQDGSVSPLHMTATPFGNGDGVLAGDHARSAVADIPAHVPAAPLVSGIAYGARVGDNVGPQGGSDILPAPNTSLRQRHPTESTSTGSTLLPEPISSPVLNASASLTTQEHLLPPPLMDLSSRLRLPVKLPQSDPTHGEHFVPPEASVAATLNSSVEALVQTAVHCYSTTPESSIADACVVSLPRVYADMHETAGQNEVEGKPALELEDDGKVSGAWVRREGKSGFGGSAVLGADGSLAVTQPSQFPIPATCYSPPPPCSSRPNSSAHSADAASAALCDAALLQLHQGDQQPTPLHQPQDSQPMIMHRSSPIEVSTATAVPVSSMVASAPNIVPNSSIPTISNAGDAARGAGTGGGAPARVVISMLTVKDVPASTIHHIGGYICARSVKIVSRVKSRQMISQERDAWWMELREELRANARAFHCNTILGYEEETQYHEDVVLLSLYGTAVMLDMSPASLRAGPAQLFRWQKQRVAEKRNCALLHLYEGPRRKGGPQGGLGFFSGEVGDLLMHHICGICRSKPVPDVLLAACTLPAELSCDVPPRLVQATVSKSKPNVKGVELAIAVSQALPFIEFALHKQLLFNLRLQELNACFSLRISIVVGPDAIVGMLTGSGCRLAGLPVPRLPRITVVDAQIARKESVVKLRKVVASRRRRRSNAYFSSSTSSSSSSSSSSSASSRSSQSAPAHSTMPQKLGGVTSTREEGRGAGSQNDISHLAQFGEAKLAPTNAVRSSSSSSSRSNSTSSKHRRHRHRHHRRNHRKRRHARTAKRGKDTRAMGSSSPSSASSSAEKAKHSATSGDGTLETGHGVATPSPKMPRHLLGQRSRPHASLMHREGAAAVQGKGSPRDPAIPSRCAATPKLRESRSTSRSASSTSSSVRSSRSRGSSRRSSSSSCRNHSQSTVSDASSQSWVPTESSETDEDVYAPADEWRTSNGKVRAKTNDYVVKIDDAEEADMILGMVDLTPFEDEILLTLPYVPDKANAFNWQERIVLDRRYSRISMTQSSGAATGCPGGMNGGGSGEHSWGGQSALGGDAANGASCMTDQSKYNSSAGAGHQGGLTAMRADSGVSGIMGGGGSGGGSAAGGTVLTTRLLNEYCADAKRAFVYRACRMAMRTCEPLRLRVVNLRIEMMFVPNSADLQLRLEGLVVVVDRINAQRLRQLEDRAFRVCMHYTMESLSGLCQYGRQQQPTQATHSGRGGSASGGAVSPQRGIGVTPLVVPSVVASGKTTPCPPRGPHSPIVTPLFNDPTNQRNTLPTGFSSTAVPVAASHPQKTSTPASAPAPQRSHGSFPHMPNSSNNVMHHLSSDIDAMTSVVAALGSSSAYCEARRLFIASNAPFSIPHVQDITTPPLRVWSGVATAFSEDTAAPAQHTSTYAECRDSRGSLTTLLSRRWHALVRATSQSFKSLVDRATGDTADRRLQQQRKQRVSLTAEEGIATQGQIPSHPSASGGGGTTTHTADARDANYSHPAARLPEDMTELLRLIPVVLFTPLDYIGGRSIVRYLGRLSQHFIREDDDTETVDDLNMFFQRAESEIMCMVQALVRLMGGNALLKHRIVYHEICDSDGSGSAFLFATVTGDVVQVSDSVYWGMQQRSRHGAGSKGKRGSAEAGEYLSSSSSADSGNEERGYAGSNLGTAEVSADDGNTAARRRRKVNRSRQRSPRAGQRHSSHVERRHRRRHYSSSTTSTSSRSNNRVSLSVSSNVNAVSGDDGDTVSSSTIDNSRAVTPSRGRGVGEARGDARVSSNSTHPRKRGSYPPSNSQLKGRGSP